MDKEQKTTYNLRIFRIMLVEGFSIEEIIILAADVCGGDHETIFNKLQVKEKIAYDLVGWCGRHSKLEHLVVLVREKNSEVYKKHEEELKKSDGDMEGIRADFETIKEAVEQSRVADAAPQQVESARVGAAEHPLARGQAEVRRWFLDELSFAEQAFVISAALFNGLQRHDLMDISSVVQGLIQPELDQTGKGKNGEDKTGVSETPVVKENIIQLNISLKDGDPKIPPPQKAEEKREPVFRDEGHLLELANLTTETATKNTESGKVTIRIVRFRDEAQRQKIIYLLANHFTEIIRKIIPLIRTLGAHVRAEVRARAARTAGELLREVDFIRIKDELLIPWALSPSMDVSINVGIALEEGAKDGQYTGNIQTLLNHWITSSNPDFNWTALASYIQLYTLWPGEAIDAIDAAIKKENSIPFLPLCNYLTSELCKNGHSEDMVARIREWMKADKAKIALRSGAALIFLAAIDFSFLVETPALLDKEVEIFTIGLSDRTLDSMGIIRAAMLDKLRSWSEESFEQSSQAEMERLFTRLFLRSDERGKERIKFSLQKWCRAAERKPDRRQARGFEDLISALPE